MLVKDVRNVILNLKIADKKKSKLFAPLSTDRRQQRVATTINYPKKRPNNLLFYQFLSA